VNRPIWNLLLLVATVLTTTWAGAAHLGIDLIDEPGRWRAGAPYALALLTILGVHEFGHYLVARRRGVSVSLPFFIPAPVYLGTFGAFIRMRGPIRDRATYFDVAIAGPLAGLVIALIALAVGLGVEAATPHGGVIPASSALLAGIFQLVGGEVLTDPISLGPLAFAGYIGLVVTALNLVPVGQLDGGHIAYALLGQRRAALLASAVIALLIIAGLLVSSHFLMWAFIVWFVAGSAHPKAQDEAAPIGPGRVVLGMIALAVLLAIVLPWPG
jgi:membrane-associated protease RseP (regulator of RpoE activity)